MLRADKGKKDLLLGLHRPAFGPEENPELGELDAKQHEIIRKALAAKDYFLIQGPPGTGKTSKVLTEIAAQLQRKEKQ
ncbi:MAG: hypothetical protein IPJ00_19305 [Saprospirales bacterium]|nr:hypothetical protein [Saprospirales bacterium]